MKFKKITLSIFLICSFYFAANTVEEKMQIELVNQQINIEKPGKLTGWNPGFRDCVNDDSTSDGYGDTCSSWYDANDYPGSYGCEGSYNDDDFDAAAQCCVCGGGTDDGSDGGDDLSCEDQGLWDCGDGQCIPPSFVCDGSSEFCNQSWPADCANGADEGLDSCGYADECEEQSDCELAGGTESYNSDGWCDASNNNEGCNWDGGDCCPSTCLDGIYSCDLYGGGCDDCLDTQASDSNYQGSCTPPCEDSAACNYGHFGDCEYETCFNYAGFVGWNSNIGLASGPSFDCEYDTSAPTYAGVLSPEEACSVAFNIDGASTDSWRASTCGGFGQWTAYECAVKDFSTNQTKLKPLILYIGNIGDGQGLHKIIPKAANELKDIQFRLIGDGGARNLLINNHLFKLQNNIEVLNPVLRNELINEYQNADILFLHLNDYKAFHKVLPSKIFEYAATGKPILAGVSGYAAEFLGNQVKGVEVFTSTLAN